MATARRRADDGSLPLAMLLTVVAVGLSVVLAALVNVQQLATRGDIQRADAINAAQAGIDVALARIRSASADGTGDLSLLPLSCGGTLLGTVTAGDTATYTTAIAYLPTSPVSGVIAAGVSALQCVGGLLSSLPLFALITSVGTARTGGITRTLSVTYAFSNTLVNPSLTGGQIRVYAGGGPDLCLATSADVVIAGSALRVDACSASSVRQQFAYQPSNALMVIGSRTATNPLGMCVDAGTAPAIGTSVIFQPCVAPLRWSQYWNLDDPSTWVNGLLCMIVSNPGTSSVIKLSGDCHDASNTATTFFPDPSVGNGHAGVISGQLVNSGQGNRCLDVTGNSIAAKSMVVFRCDQTAVNRWDQTWYLPAVTPGATSATGMIYTVKPDDNTKWCLTSSGTAGGYVPLTACPAGTPPANLTWTYRLNTGKASTSYRIESSYLRPVTSPWCVTPADPATAGVNDIYNSYAQKFGYAILALCSAVETQKWNGTSAMVNADNVSDVVEK